MRGDGSQKNRSSRLAWRGRLAALSVAIECSEALPVRTLVDLSLVMGVYVLCPRCPRFGEGNVDRLGGFLVIILEKRRAVDI
jgi:hypothetical protein